MQHLNKVTFLLSLFLISYWGYSQNLVPNPSFEVVNPCPQSLGQLTRAAPWTIPATHGGNPDLFNTCVNTLTCVVNVPNNFFGAANPYHGNGYIGIRTHHDIDSREYAQVQLTSPLIANGVYCVSFRVMRSSRSPNAINNIGMHISTGPIGQPGIAALTGYIPQIEETSVISDSSTWTLISGQYTALGGENYITMGNFRSNAATTVINRGGVITHCTYVAELSHTYYYIDSVNFNLCAVPPIAKIAVFDSVICENDCVDFTDSSSGIPVSWEWNLPGTVAGNSTEQHPSGICYTTHGVYTVSLIVSNPSGTDTTYKTITVLPEFECNNETEIYIPNTFTPDGDGVNDVFIPKGYKISEQDYELVIYDRWGSPIFKSNNLSTGWDGKANNGKNIAQTDIYVWRIRFKDVDGNQQERTGHINLVR